MAHRWKVTRSIESPCATRCVDIYTDSTGRYGFAEYRRDPEDPSGWRAVGTVMEPEFAAFDDALAAARRSVGWLG